MPYRANRKIVVITLYICNISDEPVLNSAGKVKTARKSRKRVSSKTCKYRRFLFLYAT